MSTEERRSAVGRLSRGGAVLGFQLTDLKCYQKFNAANRELGHKPTEIYSPREVTDYEPKEKDV